jgi:hypothetical protein
MRYLRDHPGVSYEEALAHASAEDLPVPSEGAAAMRFYQMEGELVQLERSAGITPVSRPAGLTESQLLAHFRGRIEAVMAEAERLRPVGRARPTHYTMPGPGVVFYTKTGQP